MVDTLQPPRLPVSETDRRRRHQDEEAVEMEQGKTQKQQGGESRPSTSHRGQGLEVKENFSTSGRGRDISLDVPLYRSDVSTHNLFRKGGPRKPGMAEC